MIRIGIIVNDEAREGFIGIHGLSIYIDSDEKILLFDTGPSAEILEYNAEKMNIDIELIDAVILSHIHTPHIGGVFNLGWSSPYLDVYIPYGSMEGLGKKLLGEGLKPHEIISDIWLSNDILVTKPLNGPPWEHFLIIRSSNGLVVFSGCIHPGLERLLEYIDETLNEDLCCIIGGFHLSNAPNRIIEKYVDILAEKAKPKLIIPLHCSGERFRELLKERIGSNSIRVLKAGDFVTID